MWNDILLWLDALRSQLGSTLHKERTQGTCRWIHRKEPFQLWKCSDISSSRLWIFGKPGILLPYRNLTSQGWQHYTNDCVLNPGVGKTMLSSYISETLKSENSFAVIIVQCHSYRSLNDPIHALARDILSQALHIPRLSIQTKRRLLDLKSQTSAISDVDFDTLLKVVNDILRGTPNIFLILDGIDEIDQQEAELESFLNKVKTLTQSEPPCKVLVVSRNTTPLEKLLAGWNTMEVSSSDSLHDIAIFLNEKLENMSHLGQHHDEVIERLVEGSKGLFLWADLAAGELNHLTTWNEIQALLENGNCGLEATYASIIKQLDTSSEGLCRIRARALPLVAVACRPLKPEELTELLAVEVSKGFIDPGNKLLGGWSVLSRACGPFLQMNELGAIELIHVSAKEFLLSYPWAKTLARGNIIDLSPDAEMACLCLSYLNFATFGITPGEGPRLDVVSITQQYPLLAYASHFCESTLYFLELSPLPVLQPCTSYLYR